MKGTWTQNKSLSGIEVVDKKEAESQKNLKIEGSLSHKTVSKRRFKKKRLLLKIIVPIFFAAALGVVVYMDLFP